jgi:hypothetical protein
MAHLFGKHPLFPKLVRTNTEQISNKTPVKIKKSVISLQRYANAVKSRHWSPYDVKSSQMSSNAVKTLQPSSSGSNSIHTLSKEYISVQFRQFTLIQMQVCSKSVNGFQKLLILVKAL